MKILFLTTAHNSLSQRLLIELTDREHEVAVTLASSDEAMLKGAAENEPELIIAPMLKASIPQAITDKHLCLIVHPGIMGDRGPSSLDWAIKNGETVWGVSILQAYEEWDAGPIFATREFKVPTPAVPKSQLYRQEVTEAAVEAVLEALEKLQNPRFAPRPLDYSHPDVRGTWRAPMRQADRAIDWSRDATEAIVAKINSADSAPGVLDHSFGAAYYLYGAHVEDRLKGAPGALLAQRDGAICVGTRDGALWITHMKLKDRVDPKEAGCGVADPGPGCANCTLEICPAAQIKLPATVALGLRAANAPKAPLAVDAAPDYRTFQEIRYVEDGSVGRLHFDFSNGAMSTDQCYRLRDAFLYARSRPTKVIELLGGADFFSNGIHLNVIEAAEDPALESWRNINAIDDVVLEILNTMSHLVVAGVCGNAGAGGAIMPLAADYVYAREGVVFNPHYKGMGGLYGSEYWTYTLPRRVGAERALELTEGLKPMGTREAKRIGFIDDAFGASVAEFQSCVAERSAALAARADFWQLLRDKHERRLADERAKPLAAYRAEELARMRENFWGPDPAYHAARRRFVYKGEPRRPRETVAAVAENARPGLLEQLVQRARAFKRREAS
jgi:putative two-component system hydrogenase maturation factor HypX/HoxX